MLRIGLFDSVQLGVPPAVATDGAAHTIRRLGLGSASTLVDAVLRRAIPAWSEELALASPDLRLSHPAWLYQRWAGGFGAQAAEDIMAADQLPAPMWVWFLDDSARQDLDAAGAELEAHPWCPDAWCSRGDVRQLVERLSAGDAYAQDPSSQMVARIAHGLAGSGGRFVDLCAAPGGKAAIILRRERWREAVACELRPRRARLMRRLVERAGDCSVVVADSVLPPFPDQAFNLVLLDAPIDAGLALVVPGGAFVFATCSIEPEENEGHFEESPAGFERVDLEAHLPSGVPWRETGAGGIRILPHMDGDGFSVHALRKSDQVNK
jgi:16S rRNA (cytosine967-C5)-methyltransferase